MRFTTEGDLADELERARAAGCDLAIIDTPPGRSSEAPAAVESADLVLIPFTAEDVDAFDGVPPTARLARMAGKPAAEILNFAFPGSKAQEETARGVLGGDRPANGPGHFAPLQRAPRRQPQGTDRAGVRPRQLRGAGCRRLVELGLVGIAG